MTPRWRRGLLLAWLVASTGCFEPVCERGDTSCAVAPGAADGSASRSSRALRFDGVDDLLEVAPDSAGTDQSGFTVELWFKTTSPAGTLAEEFLGGGGTHAARKRLYLQAGAVCGTQAGLGGVTQCTGAATYADGAWHHAALSSSGTEGTQALCVDGVLQASGPVIHTSGFIYQQAFRLGCSTSLDQPVDFFRGELDEIRIWTVARSAAELAAARTTTLRSGAGLEVSLPLEGAGSDATAPDAAGAHRDAALEHFEFAPSPWTAPGAF